MPNDPLATCRLQLHAGFRFADAVEIVPYLARLGVSHVYTSPILQAAPGSLHGYDVNDCHQVNQELGGEEGRLRFVAALKENGLLHLLDIVPNHMSIAAQENRWWWDILELGHASRYAPYFDIDWEAGNGTLLLPILGDHLANALEKKELGFKVQDGLVVFAYYEQTWPLAPSSVGAVLAQTRERMDLPTVAAINRRFAAIQPPHYQGWEDFKAEFARAYHEDPSFAGAIESAAAALNADPKALLSIAVSQYYRLAYWRLARERMGHRRFFSINSLAGVCVHSSQVFKDTHRLILEWLSDGSLDGVRVDHIDGLRNPQEYLNRLRAAAPDAWILVEKILEKNETLPETWPVAGTTGYEFAKLAGGLLVDPAGEGPLTSAYARFVGETAGYAETALAKKRQTLERLLWPDIRRLANLLDNLCAQRGLDFTQREIISVLVEALASFPVYRSYVRTEDKQVSPDDLKHISEATGKGAQALPAELHPLLDFLKDVLLLRVEGELADDLALRFQQLSGPVMAKGIEDTLFYCYNRLLALNEVGGDPGAFSVSLQEFHEANQRRQSRWPLSMLATSTHDTKRSEDVRARLSLLSEIPDQWDEAAQQWKALNQPRWKDATPDRNMEYHFYQTLVGAWPLSVERAVSYMEKASREAGERTSWIDPDPAYEKSLLAFVEECLGDRQFTEDVAAFAALLEPFGRLNSLAQTLVKLTAPGVPDIYQGTELWDFSLVDPDNRRPVDFALRRRLLASLEGATPRGALENAESGLPKLWITWKTLGLRKRIPEAFGKAGSYTPLRAEGAKSKHVVAFVRGGRAITIAPRLVWSLAGDWGDTTLALPSGRWRNEFTGETATGVTELRTLLREFPVALLSLFP